MLKAEKRHNYQGFFFHLIWIEEGDKFIPQMFALNMKEGLNTIPKKTIKEAEESLERIKTNIEEEKKGSEL